MLSNFAEMYSQMSHWGSVMSSSRIPQQWNQKANSMRIISLVWLRSIRPCNPLIVPMQHWASFRKFHVWPIRANSNYLAGAPICSNWLSNRIHKGVNRAFQRQRRWRHAFFNPRGGREVRWGWKLWLWKLREIIASNFSIHCSQFWKKRILL